MDAVDYLLSGQQPPKKERDALQMLLEGTVPADVALGGETEKKPYLLQTGQEPTGEVSTITGKPFMKSVPVGEQAPSFGTEIQAQIVDDPKTRMSIYAKARFPNMPLAQSITRYGMHNGRIVFLADDGKLYYEDPGAIKGFGAGMVAHSPAIIGGTIGAAAGPGTAGILAAGGEAARKIIANLVYDEPQTSMGNAWDILKEGAWATGGELTGRVFGFGYNAAQARKLRTLNKEAGRDFKLLNSAEVRELNKRAQEYGINLTIPELTQSRTLIDQFNILGDLEHSADLIQGIRMARVKEIDDAVYKYLNTIAPEKDLVQVGREVADASKKALNDIVAKARKEAAPYYLNAAAKNPNVDVQPILKIINEKLRFAKGNIRQNLLKVKKLFFNLNKTKIDKTLNHIEGVKDEVGNMLDLLESQVGKRSQANKTYRHLSEIKSRLLEQMDAASPDYAKARRIYAEDITPINMAKQTRIGQLSKIETDDQLISAAKGLFSATKGSPEALLTMKNLIEPINPEAWKAASRVFIQDLYESIKNTALAGRAQNIGGRAYTLIFRNRKQAKLLKQALGDTAYNNLHDFMDLLRKTSVLYEKESATATRQITLERMKRRGQSRMLMATTRPLYTYQRLMGDWANELMWGKYQKQLAEAMVSPKTTEAILQLKMLKPNSQKYLNQLTTFFTEVMHGGFSE